MLENVKFIVLSHYDFKDEKSGNQVRGSKIVLTNGGNTKLELSTQNEEVFELEVLKTYYCDLFVNDKLKIDISNIQE